MDAILSHLSMAQMGWVLFAALAWMVVTLIVRGKLWVDPHVQEILRRNSALEDRLKVRDDQIALLLKEGLPAQNAFQAAVKEMADQITQLRDRP